MRAESRNKSLKQEAMEGYGVPQANEKRINNHTPYHKLRDARGDGREGEDEGDEQDSGATAWEEPGFLTLLDDKASRS